MCMGSLILAEETIQEDNKCVMAITKYINQQKNTSPISEKGDNMKLWILKSVPRLLGFNCLYETSACGCLMSNGE